jgi:hypothetical protein
MERELRIMRMTTTTMKSIRTDTQHTIVVPNIFPTYMIPITVCRIAASLAMPAKTLAQPDAAFNDTPPLWDLPRLGQLLPLLLRAFPFLFVLVFP